jgi:hypothetical protein
LARIQKELFLLYTTNKPEKNQMKKLFASAAIVAILVSVITSCKGRRETCPAYGSKYQKHSPVSVRSI